MLQLRLSICGRNCSSLRERFSGHKTAMKNPFADNKCKKLSKHFGVGFCRNVNYIANIIEKLSGSGGVDRIGDEYMAEKEKRVVNRKLLPLDHLYKLLGYKKSKLNYSFLKQSFVKVLAHILILSDLFVFPSNPLKRKEKLTNTIQQNRTNFNKS